MVSSGDAERKHFSEALTEAVFLIHGLDGSYATVFIVSCSSDSSFGYPTLITARHVLDGMKSDSAVIDFRKYIGDGNYNIIPDTIAIRKNGVRRYIVHPDSTIDIAGMFIEIPPEVIGEFSPFHRSLIASEDDFRTLWIHPSDKVFFLGYPLLRSSPKGQFPIHRSGHIASYPISPTSDNPYIHIDATVFEGNSGSPVYFPYNPISWNRKLELAEGRILGVLSSYRYADAKRKIDTILQRHDLRLGVMVNSVYILDILDSLNSILQQN